MEAKISELKKVFEKEICANCIRTRKCDKKDRDTRIEVVASQEPQGIWLLCVPYINRQDAEKYPELLKAALNGETLM